MVEVSTTEPYQSIFSPTANIDEVGAAEMQNRVPQQMVILYYPFTNDENPTPSQVISFGDYLHRRTKRKIADMALFRITSGEELVLTMLMMVTIFRPQ